MGNKISVKELKEFLEKGTLSNPENYSEVDIVFIAGIFLLCMTKKQIGTIQFVSDGNSIKKEIHKSYIKQIDRLYGKLLEKSFFEYFPGSTTPGAYTPNNYSSSFAPPIYINQETINCFFGDKENDEIKDLKDKYIENLEKRNTFANKQEEDYFSHRDNITRELEKSSPIHTFIFSVAYHKIKPFVSRKNKGIDSPTSAIKQLWNFTQEYVRGLHELAKNIVEHSGKSENDGQGMITFRAYSENESDTSKVLETHVFDYGEKGIIKKLKEYTTNLKEHYSAELKKAVLPDEKKWLTTMLNCYEGDLNKLSINYELSNFIIPPTTEDQELQQQIFRDIAHFGLRKFYQLISKYNGEVYLSSNGNYFDKDKKADVVKNKTIDFTGTSFFFHIPFNPSKFTRANIATTSQVNLTTTLGSTQALQELHKYQYLEISPSSPDNIKQCIEDGIKAFVANPLKQEEDVFLDYKLSFQVNDKRDVPKLYQYFEIPKEIINTNINYIAIDLENTINDVSILLRFLSHLTAKYEYPFIIYNLSNELYNDMVLDIENFYNERHSQSEKAATYWHENRAILFYTKTKEHDFYFADILYGKDENDFLLANKIINNTFPNSKTILQEKNKSIAQKYSIRFSSNKNLNSFFNDKLLLPFDTVLTKKPEGIATKLFISNLTTILKRELPKRYDYSYTDLNSYIEKIGGYHISKTHFRIGSKIHTEDFYYAKGLFQNSFYTTRIAMYLANKLANEIVKKQIRKLTLIGYEMYSELLLSLVVKFLVDKLDEYLEFTANHFIAQDEDGKLHFKPYGNYEDFINGKYKEENSYATVIVPIASTGSTAQKILEMLKDSIISYEKNKISNGNKTISKDEALDLAKKEAKKLNLLSTSYNILWAKPNGTSDYGLIVDSINIDGQSNIIKQESIIELPAVWHSLKNCQLCYGEDENGGKVNTLPLFETDKSSLTPAIVFENPVGKTQVNTHDITNTNFDEVTFSGSLKYMTTYRNNEFLLYSTDTDKLIENEKNKFNIINWLQTIKTTLSFTQYEQYLRETFPPKANERGSFVEKYNTQEAKSELKEEMFNEFIKLYKKDKTTAFTEWGKFFITPSDKIVIISPCHETNGGFLNLVNKYVFNSAATIIHYQTNVDFAENFMRMNSQYIKNHNTKIFYVDDSLITGKHFFNLFDLVSSIKEISQFDGTIVLSDKTAAFAHNRIVRWSKFMFSFVSYNQPPSISLSEQRPLEYEQKRYKTLSNQALHDALISAFNQKVEKLNPEKSGNEPASRRQECLFETTHKIYDYFSKNGNADYDVSSESFVSFKDKTNTIENDNVKIKVLSQYPFILYKPLREETFKWHKELLNQSLRNIEKLDIETAINAEEYKEIFTTFKLLMRRAVFLSNYEIIEQDFLAAIQKLFVKIGNYFDIVENHTHKQRLDDEIEKNLKDFPIYLIRNYLEIMHKNGWVALKLVKNLTKLKEKFSNSTSLSKQFFRMLQIESAIVVDDYVRIIEKEHHFKWRDMCKFTLDTKYTEENERKLNYDFVTNTLYIRDFFKKNEKKLIDKINRYEIVKEFFSEKLPDKWYENTDEKTPVSFENYLWIKQLIFNDTIDKSSFFPQNISYQDKIDNILEKMKGLFHNENIQAFFIVTDNEQTPYVLYDKEYLLQNLEREYHSNSKEIKNLRKNKNQDITTEGDLILDNLNFSEIFRFLYGMSDMQGIAVETIKEYEKDNDTWKDCYNDKNRPQLNFVSDDKYKYLLLIRLSNLGSKGEFITSGMLGFYAQQKLCNESDSILSKQLLMLLRRDMSAFIEKHHKNNEFSALRQAELTKRFAYLAGHGKQTMSRLENNNKTKDLAHAILPVMEKLQYLYATHYMVKDNSNQNSAQTKSTISEILKLEFPLTKEINNGLILNEESPCYLRDMVKKIYESEDVENEVTMQFESCQSNNDYDTLANLKIDVNNFYFNEDILFFILFEMIVNAKKNRWHCLDHSQERHDCCRNKLEIKINKIDGNLVIEISSTGAEAQNTDKINKSIPVKSKSENEGLYLISSVLRDITEGRFTNIEPKTEVVPYQKESDNNCKYSKYCRLNKNTFILTIKSNENERH